jgi:hypothetical protein
MKPFSSVVAENEGCRSGERVSDLETFYLLMHSFERTVMFVAVSLQLIQNIREHAVLRYNAMARPRQVRGLPVKYIKMRCTAYWHFIPKSEHQTTTIWSLCIR